MSCNSCGTELPVGAMFCGECGRAVSAGKTPPRASASDPVAHPGPSPGKSFPPVDEAEEHCPQCASVVRLDDVFCGECGFVVHATVHRNRDTVIVEPIDIAAPVESWLPDLVEWAKPGAVTDAVDAAAPDQDTDDGDDSGAPDADAAGAPAEQDEDEPDGDDEPEEPEPDESAEPEGLYVEREQPRRAPPLTSAAFLFDDADHEHTRIVQRRDQGERFILQFSTGESVSVFGSGLLGRNPVPEPGEFFDQFVAISDPGKSVSKTHLEFGQEAGAFWVSDRFSGNGSVVREPDVGARRCEPGKRYRMVRGSRVDIGEQFFVVS